MLLTLSPVLAGTACRKASPRPDTTSFDPALVREQQRRIASFDSVVRSINTDSAYKLWHWTLTAPNAKVGQQQVECEYGRLMDRYGHAADAAIGRMEDTLWREVDGDLVRRMHVNLKGMSLPINNAVCGPPPAKLSPYWLREWTIYPLPQLPPSPTDSSPRVW